MLPISYSELLQGSCEGVEWIELAQYSVQCRTHVKILLDLRVAQEVWNFLTSCATVSCVELLYIYDVYL